jgi:hypothetical protein
MRTAPDFINKTEQKGQKFTRSLKINFEYYSFSIYQLICDLNFEINK